MLLVPNSNLVSILEMPEIEINFYFPYDLSIISAKLDSNNSPLRFKSLDDELRVYTLDGYNDDEFCLMENSEDWLYDDNELKTQMSLEHKIKPKSLLFYQTRLVKNSATLTKLIKDYLVSERVEFFLLAYNQQEGEDMPIYVNKQ